MAAGTGWTEPELIAVLSLYRQIPFGQMRHQNDDVIRVAGLIGRTPSAVAMKLGNFASFDPEHRKRGVGGLSNASMLDEAVWNRYASDWSRLADAIELPDPDAEGVALPPPPSPAGEVAGSSRPEGVSPDHSAPPGRLPPLGPLPPDTLTSADRLVAVRRGQNFFRRTVLSAYESRCCVTGLATPSLLRAGHIVPWTARESTRLDPHNGLCLNALHDAAFDRGLMTLDEDMRVVYAKSLWKADHSPEAAAMLRQFEGVECRQASRHAARGEYLEWHRERVFARV